MTKFTTKLFTASLLMLISVASHAQVIFSETFDNVPGSTAGGAGTYAFPAGWFLRNVDNKTPFATVSYVNEAWERREDFSFDVNDSCAFSTSYYTVAGAADDWMWTPLIGPIAANGKLTWNAVVYDIGFADAYEVRVMTAASGPPTGGSGAIGNQVTNSTVIFTTGTTGENAVWTPHSVSLAAYAGQSVYIGFRNNANDKFLLLIDDVVVENPVNYDASITATDTVNQYTAIPLTQSQPMKLGATITNNGLLAVTNVRLKVDVLDAFGASISTATSTPLPSLATATSAHITVPSFLPSAINSYGVRYDVLINEADGIPANDTIRMSNVLVVNDSIYARDNNSLSGSLGIGAGTVGYLGQQYDVINTDTITSISYYLTRGWQNRRAALAVWDMAGGFPNQIIGGTDTIIYPDDSARFYTLQMHGGYLPLTPGIYVVTAIEFDSTLALGQANSIFTLKTTWVDWAANPVSPWGNNEAYGGGFSKTYIIRPNFSTAPIDTYVGDAKGITNVGLYPNPARNELYLNVRTSSPSNLFVEMFDSFGKQVKTLQLGYSDKVNEKISISGLSDGLYFVVIHAGDDVVTSKVTILK